jgi:ribonuclease HI
VTILSQKVEKPTVTDYNEVKRVIRYLKTTKTLCLRMSTYIGEPAIKCFSDANWAENRENRKSNSGYFCTFYGGAISWSCKKQEIVTLSTLEAEYVALSETIKETIWLTRLVQFFGFSTEENVTVMTDSQSCMKYISNDKFSNRTKHVDTKYHFVKDLVSKKQVKLNYVPTDQNIADMFTKPLQSTKLKYLRELSGMTQVSCTIEGSC